MKIYYAMKKGDLVFSILFLCIIGGLLYQGLHTLMYQYNQEAIINILQ